MLLAFKYAYKHGIEGEDVYPAYEAYDENCREVSSDLTFPIHNACSVKPNSADALKAALAHGPVSVAIEADTMVFQFYSHGTLTSTACGNDLDHGVLAVGYG